MTETKTIPLCDLVHDEAANAGHEKRMTQIGDLLASIPAHGIIQSLRVRPIRVPGKGHDKVHAVIAGNRRLAALKQLAADGTIAENFPVPVIVSKEDDKAAHELSAAENIERLPMSPVEEFQAYAQLRDDGQTAEAIALRFGVPERRVQQRLRLAGLHPDVVAALDAGEITLDAAAAFTVQPDPELQRQHLEVARNNRQPWELQAGNIRRAMTDSQVSGRSELAKLIGEDAYLAAGGEIVTDLFGDDSWWVSDDILKQLVVRDQCAAAGVAFLFKQWGEWLDADQLLDRIDGSDAFIARDGVKWAPERPLNFTDAAFLAEMLGHPHEHQSDGRTGYRLGKGRAGRVLDGVTHDGFPEGRG